VAALQIDSDPQKYFPGIKLNAPSDTGIVTVPDYMHADTLAKALNVREGALRELNPALMDTVWAGDKFVPKGFSLRVPLATAAVAEDLLAAIDAAERFAGQRPDLQHRVRRGDTLSAIAAEYHVSLAALMRANGLSARDMIRVGQMISLPVDSRGTAAPAATVVLARADPSPPSAPAAAPASATSADGTYTVRNGDSIDRIAKRLKVSAEELLAANTLGNKNLIYPGQKLNVPGAAAEVPVTAVVAANTEPATVAAVALATAPRAVGGGEQLAGIATDELEAALAPAVLANGEPAPADEAATTLDEGDVNALASVQDDLAADPSDYSVSATNQIQVQALETLGHYADWLEIPTQRLRDLNTLSFREAVVIGQMLTLDFRSVDAPTFEQRRVAFHQQQQGEFFAAYQIADIESHTIKSGESLWVLAARTYKVPVWLLRQYNPDLNLDRVLPGTVVKFPRLKKAVGGQDAIAPVAAPAAVVAPATVAQRAD
jgi:membrane-bound lytic murein transglycosylase D